MRITSLITILLCCLHLCHGQTITLFAGNGSLSIDGDNGPATSAGISHCVRGNFDGIGNYYFCNGVSGYSVRMIDTFGIIHTVAGNGTGGFSGDNGPATSAQLGWVLDVAVDDSGNLFIADSYNYRIRKLNTSTHIITTVAGNGIDAYSPDGIATASSLQLVYGMCFDSHHNLYFTDSNTRIRKLDDAGMLTTVVGTGTGGFTGDNGPATAATIYASYGLCYDGINTIYLADSGGLGHIRKVDLSTGIITRFAGNGGVVFNGDEINADMAGFNCGYDIKADASGNVYIADYGNSRIRLIDNDHIIHTIAGTGIAGYSGDGGPAKEAQINQPQGLAIDKCGNLYIADTYNQRIRKVAMNPNCWPLAVEGTTTPSEAELYPLPVYNTLHIDKIKATCTYSLTDVCGRIIRTGQLQPGSNEIDMQPAPPGMYILQLRNTNGETKVYKVMKE